MKENTNKREETEFILESIDKGNTNKREKIEFILENNDKGKYKQGGILI